MIPGLERSFPLFSAIISFFNIFIGVELIYNVMLVSGIQQSDSVYIYIRIHIHSFSDPFPLQVITK